MNIKAAYRGKRKAEMAEIHVVQGNAPHKETWPEYQQEVCTPLYSLAPPSSYSK